MKESLDRVIFQRGDRDMSKFVQNRLALIGGRATGQNKAAVAKSLGGLLYQRREDFAVSLRRSLVQTVQQHHCRTVFELGLEELLGQYHALLPAHGRQKMRQPSWHIGTGRPLVASAIRSDMLDQFRQPNQDREGAVVQLQAFFCGPRFFTQMCLAEQIGDPSQKGRFARSRIAHDDQMSILQGLV